MGQKQYLIDSNAAIDYLGKKLPDSGTTFMDGVIDMVPNLSIITKIEVLGFKTTQDQYNVLSSFIEDSVIFDLTDPIADKTILIRRKYKTKLPDAIIAATVMVYDLSLITRNIKDFKKIKGLKLIDPYNR